MPSEAPRRRLLDFVAHEDRVGTWEGSRLYTRVSSGRNCMGAHADSGPSRPEINS